MLYLDDRLPTHPKILKAGARLGPGGASKALHLYVMGLAYARQNLTDGFIPESFLLSVRGLFASDSVAVALADKRVRLWRKVRGGYRIHDYHHYNPKAAKVKEKRELDRQRKARERERRIPNVSTMDTSRTRARAVPVPRTTKRKRTSTDASRRPGILHPVEIPSFALACVVMREAIDQADPDTSLSTVGEVFKTFCARRGLAYDGDLVRRAYDACAVTAVMRRRA